VRRCFSHSSVRFSPKDFKDKFSVMNSLVLSYKIMYCLEDKQQILGALPGNIFSLIILPSKSQSKKFDVMMIPVNCIDEPARKIFTTARDNGIGIIAMKPLAGGNIRKYDSAIRYVLNLPVSTALIGMARIKEVKQNISVLKNLTITHKDNQYYKKIRRQLGDVFCRYCGHCIFPEPCPREVPVRTIMMLETLAYQANLKRNISEKILKSIDNCIKCGLCEKRCPYKLPIRKLLPLKVKKYIKMTSNIH